jgi:large subunit ribosomal protein L22e
MPGKTHSKVRNNPRKEQAIKYVVNLKQPIEDGVFELSDFENHVKESLKLNGKKGLSDVVISSEDSNRLVVSTKILFSKRYIKYLAKKYLKKQDLRDYLRVVATDKHTYTVKFVNMGEGAAAEGN